MSIDHEFKYFDEDYFVTWLAIMYITGDWDNFMYDSNNQLVSILYNGKEYFYVRNILGDILGIVDNIGEFVVKYKYDAFGNTLDVIAGSSVDTYANVIRTNNPFRYKGYYYDVETQLFYCNSRYYSPELCRWISPDSIEYLDPESINGLNLYAYCENDPINKYDPTGHFAISLTTIGLIVGAVIGATAGGIVAFCDPFGEGMGEHIHIIGNVAVSTFAIVGGIAFFGAGRRCHD